MNKTFNNRVFGCAIIKSINSSYNADFTHQPRTLPNGIIYATDKALKYTVRNYWVKNYAGHNEEKVFFFKSLNDDMKPRTLDETYNNLFGDYPKRAAKTKKSGNKPDEYFLFEYDGTEVKGLLTDKPKTKQVKDFFKALDEDSPLKTFSGSFEKITGKDCESKPLESAKSLINSEDEEGYFFYFEKGAITKIEGEYIQVKEAANEVDNLVSGGLDRIKILSNLLTCLDIKLFGATYAGEVNLSIHGTVQITHAINKYVEGIIYSEQISSPFRNSNEKSADSMQTTLGTQSKLKEGHYVHHFSVNPSNLKDLAAKANNPGITISDIEKLKEALRCGATFYDSSSKTGTENELLLWVQLKEGSKLVLPSFVELVNVNENREIDLGKISTLLSKEHIQSQIERIELYYDNTVTKVINVPAGALESELC